MGFITIGHSNRDLAGFAHVLREYAVTAVADVRSVPSSRYVPQFDRQSLKRHLAKEGISYVFLGEELGARSADRRCYEGRSVSYPLLAASQLFQEGIMRLEAGMRTERIAILCAEGEPLDCHRSILISPVLTTRGHAVSHIRRDDSLEPHEVSIRRLRSQYGLLDVDLFRDDKQLAGEALNRQARRIAFVADDQWAQRIGLS